MLAGRKAPSNVFDETLNENKKRLTAKGSVMDVLQGSEYVSAYL